jgi:hypothetical protein
MPINAGFQTKTFGGQVNILDSQHVRYVRGGVTIDKAKVSDGFNQTIDGRIRKILPAGVPLARNSTSGKYVPVRSTTVASGGGAGVTTCVLTEAKPFMAGDAITIGGDAVTIATISYATKTITWSGGVTIADGEAVLGTGGEGTARCMLAEEVDATDFDQVTHAFDHARVIEVRLPMAIAAQVKADLRDIAFI